jgi:hypothetical protein
MEFRGVNRTLDNETIQVAGASKSERIRAFLEDHERATVFLQRHWVCCSAIREIDGSFGGHEMG